MDKRNGIPVTYAGILDSKQLTISIDLMIALGMVLLHVPDTPHLATTRQGTVFKTVEGKAQN
eukprot:804904-Amphidinium_carterae.1